MASVDMAERVPPLGAASLRGTGARVWRALTAERVTISVSVLALLLRLWGINFGLPYAVHPDEPVVNGTVLHMLRVPTANPDTFIYPSGLYYYLVVIASLYQLITGHLIGSPPDTTGLGLYPNPDAIIWMRVGVALIGVAAVAVVYRTTRALVGPWPALGAALLLACSPLHIIQSQIATTDGVSATGVTLLAACCVLAVRTESRRAFWFAGIALGLATGIKYNVAVGGVMLLAAFGVVYWREHRRGLLSLRGVLHDRRLLAFAFAPLAFLVTTPFALLAPGPFLKDVGSVFLHYDVQGHPGVAGSSLVYTLSEMFGHYETLLSALACVGVVYALLRRRSDALIVAAGAAAYFILVAAPKVHFERNLVPLWPLLAILAGEGIAAIGALLALCGTALARRIRGRGSLIAMLAQNRFIQAVVVVAVLLVLLQPTLARAVQSDSIRAAPDVQATASFWINQHVPAGATIAYESYSVTLDPQRFRLTYLRAGLYTEPLEWYAEQHIQYAVASQMYYARFFDATPEDFPSERAAYADMFAHWTIVQTFVGSNTDGGMPGGKIVLLRITPPGTRAAHPVAPYP
ncbi:MAG: glycosyltransferase family 39 protein [Ktedonobacterales bacterium]